MNKNRKELIAGVELYSSAREFQDKGMAERCWREIRDE